MHMSGETALKIANFALWYIITVFALVKIVSHATKNQSDAALTLGVSVVVAAIVLGVLINELIYEIYN